MPMQFRRSRESSARKSAYADFGLRKYLVQRGRNRRESASSPILTILGPEAFTEGNEGGLSRPRRQAEQHSHHLHIPIRRKWDRAQGSYRKCLRRNGAVFCV